jgi:hypothetical protein
VDLGLIYGRAAGSVHRSEGKLMSGSDPLPPVHVEHPRTPMNAIVTRIGSIVADE